MAKKIFVGGSSSAPESGSNTLDNAVRGSDSRISIPEWVKPTNWEIREKVSGLRNSFENISGPDMSKISGWAGKFKPALNIINPAHELISGANQAAKYADKDENLKAVGRGIVTPIHSIAANLARVEVAARFGNFVGEKWNPTGRVAELVDGFLENDLTPGTDAVKLIGVLFAKVGENIGDFFQNLDPSKLEQMLGGGFKGGMGGMLLWNAIKEGIAGGGFTALVGFGSGEIWGSLEGTMQRNMKNY